MTSDSEAFAYFFSDIEPKLTKEQRAELMPDEWEKDQDEWIRYDDTIAIDKYAAHTDPYLRDIESLKARASTFLKRAGWALGYSSDNGAFACMTYRPSQSISDPNELVALVKAIEVEVG